MRSIFTTILLWGVATVGVSLVGYYATSRLIDRGRPHMHGGGDMMGKTQDLQLEGARIALEEGGPEKLAQYLQRLNDLFEAEHFLVDASGKDLVDGTDRSALQARAMTKTRPGPPPSSNTPVVLSHSSSAGGPRLLISVPPRPHGGGDFLPYYLWILLVIVLLGYGLAVHLARPLRRLRLAVDRFGRGDLSTRIGSNRRDEIGELARAFDTMAGRIETLMAAERRLLQDVSHELRSPLARLGFAVELARTGGDPKVSIDRIKRDVDRLSALVGELLELTSAEGDPLARVVEPVLLDELLRDLEDDCSLEAEAKGCRLVLREGGPVAVLGDRELLRRAVENVLRNAIRHTPEGSTVEVELQSQPDRATISVRDHGTGVPEEAVKAIFDPFFRVDDDRSRASGGVGLGLSIARRAVELHRGTIEARNARPGLLVAIELPSESSGSA
jgi:two-component system sensor histidine kinase CpxA